MRLRRITIKNFRSLRHVDIQVNQNPLVILGENNVGKSNLLLALRLLLGTDAQKLRIDLTEDDINKTARKLGESFFQITLEIGDLQKHPDVETCFKERIDTEGNEHFIRIQGVYKLDDKNEDYVWETLLIPSANRSNEPLSMTKRMYEAIPLFFLDAMRDSERETRPTGTGMLSQLLRGIEYDDVAESVVSKLKDANESLSSSEEIRSLSANLTQQLTDFVLGGQVDLRIVVADEDISLLSRSFRLQLRKNPNNIHESLARQGTGLQNLTLISILRHQIQKKQEENWRKTPILAIEEPETHLYPHTQRRLFRDLSMMNMPVIITTHSPAIVKYANPSNLVILRSETPDETTSYQLSSTFPQENKKQLSQLIRLDGAEVFFARVIIAVEGVSELIALPAFAEQLGCDLDRDGISILNVGSTSSFEPILRAFMDNQFATKYIVIYDEDVLQESPKLVKQAVELGVVSEADFQACRKDTASSFQKRKSLLNYTIGWFGVTDCFEHVVAENGYFDTMLEAIKNNDPIHNSDYKAFERYIEEKQLTLNASSLLNFMKEKKRNGLKVPIAHAIAEAVPTIQVVPDCFKAAIRHATLLSLGGIRVDEYFELRACASGFKEILCELITREGLTQNLKDLKISTPHLSDVKILHLFFSETNEGLAIRNKAKNLIADAVEKAGCSGFANTIRDTAFPN